jgi:hypothetical protein
MLSTIAHILDLGTHLVVITFLAVAYVVTRRNAGADPEVRQTMRPWWWAALAVIALHVGILTAKLVGWWP